MSNFSVDRRQLECLAAWAPNLRAPDFEPGQWVIETGHFPYFAYGEVAAAFVHDLYRHGLIIENFDWPSWIESSEARGLLESPAALRRATPAQLAKLLTASVRKDRFCEGALADAFSSGCLLAICERAADLSLEV